MKWTNKQVMDLKKLYPREDITISDLMKKFDRTKRAICHKASRMDLRRPKSKKSSRDKGLRKKYDREWFQKNKERLFKMRKERQKKIKIELINLLGGKCNKCGYNKCISELDFHHKKNKGKEDNVSFFLYRGYLKKAKKEAKKCILLCSNCHRELHWDRKY